MPVSDEELRKLNPKGELVARSLKKFPRTFDCREAGFILEDGDMLDFSGKREGGTPKTRSLDHREICEAIEHGGKGISGGECLDFFERQANALRFGTYGTWERGHDIIVQLNTYQSPTEKQRKRVERCCALYKVKYVAYDVFDDGGNRLESGDVEKKTCAEMTKGVFDVFSKAKKEEEARKG